MSSSEHRLALPSGFQIEDYRFLRVLGQGGFGITYLAKDVHLEREVAIKENLPPFATRIDGFTIVPKSEQDEASFKWAKESFITEARTLAKLNHPNIVKVIRLLERNGTAYMVMEFVHGRNFEEWLREHGRPIEDQLRGILLPLLDGLQALHTLRILHRDISPENILISDDGQPILIDFGSARANLDSAKDVTGIVRPGYSPFEQYQKEARQGAYTDFYSLAGVMIRAITGVRPPGSFDRIQGPDPYVPLSQRFRGKYSAGFLYGIDRAFSIECAERPQSVPEWKKMLSGVAPPPPSKPKPAPKPKPQDPPRPKPSIDKSAQKRFRIWLLVAGLGLLVAAGLVIFYENQTAVPRPPQGTPMPLGTGLTQDPPRPPPSVLGSPQPAVSVDLPDMEFVTVPSLPRVQFCKHSTRVKDFAKFAADIRDHPELIDKLRIQAPGTAWQNPKLPGKPVANGPEYPVVMVSWDEADSFCKWFSLRKSERDQQNVLIRLPSKDEWWEVRGDAKYIWGNEEQRPEGNYSGTDLAPAIQYQPNRLGIFQFGSNVQEWSKDLIREVSAQKATLLGFGWLSKDQTNTTFAEKRTNYTVATSFRRADVGFRCVMEVSGSAQK